MQASTTMGKKTPTLLLFENSFILVFKLKFQRVSNAKLKYAYILKKHFFDWQIGVTQIT